MDDPLIYARAVHFAATVTVTGVAFFVALIAEPTFRQAGHAMHFAAIIRPKLRWIAWGALAAMILSGAAWFLVVAQSMSDRTFTEIFSEHIFWTVLTQTGFGRDWLVRLVITSLLAAMFIPLLSTQGSKSAWIKTVVVALAAGLVGSLAWSGHAAGGSGSEALIHPAADFLHLVAAAAWLGMLAPLALVLSAAGGDAAALPAARIATVRFSNFGIASVGTLVITGVINTRYLVGSIAALTQTDYGHLLLAKVALFVVMVAVAAVNRYRLTPRLLQNRQNITAADAADALRQLRRNTVIEVAIGAVIIAIVTVLGMSPPGYFIQMPQAYHHAH